MKEKYFVYTVKANKEQMDELINYLKTCSCDFSVRTEDSVKLIVHEKESDYVEAAMCNWNIDYMLIEVEWKINWNKIKVDTPVLVKDNNMEKWVKAHFADFVDGCVYTFPNGLTSHTYEGIMMVGWDEAKIVK